MIVIDKQIYLPDDKVFKDEVLNEAHESKFIVCPSSTKMYQDLKEFYWWPNMKKEVVGYVAMCVVCQQVKVKHQKLARPLQPLLVHD